MKKDMIESLIEDKIKRSKGLGERILFWIGSVTAILVSIFTLHNEISQKKPADLQIEFASTGSNFLEVKLPKDTVVVDENLILSKPIPFELIVKNYGEKTAFNVVLGLINPIEEGFSLKLKEVKSETFLAEQKSIITPYGKRIMTTLQLGEIHPGQPKHLEYDILVVAAHTTIFKMWEAVIGIMEVRRRKELTRIESPITIEVANPKRLDKQNEISNSRSEEVHYEFDTTGTLGQEGARWVIVEDQAILTVQNMPSKQVPLHFRFPQHVEWKVLNLDSLSN